MLPFSAVSDSILQVTVSHILKYPTRCLKISQHLLLLLISMLWYRQATFVSKGDKLSSSAECRIRNQGLRHLIASRLNANRQTDWAIEDQAKTRHTYIHTYVRTYIHTYVHTYVRTYVRTYVDTYVRTYIHTYISTYTYLLFDFDSALAQGSNFDSKGDKVTSSAECRIRTLEVWDTKSPEDWMSTHKPTELSRIKLKTWTQHHAPMMSEHAADLTSLQPAWFHCRNWFTPGSGDIHICCLIFIVLLHREGISNRKETACLPLLNAGLEPWKSETPNHQQTECSLTNRLSYRGSN